MPALALPDPPLSDGVVALRGFDLRDVAALVEACQETEIQRWTLVPRSFDAARGRGHATRAVELLAGWAFGTLGLAPLELRVQEDNHASQQRVAARAGFARVAQPLVQRPECDHLPDVHFARERGG